MKFLKFLSLVMMLNITLCFGCDSERYKAFAEKEITGWIEAAKSEPIRNCEIYHLDINEIETHFEKTNELFHELVDIIVQLDSEERYNNIDTKLKIINDHTDEFFTGAMWSSVTSDIYRAERYLLDINGENGFKLVDREHPIIQKYIKIWDDFFDESDPSTEEDE